MSAGVLLAVVGPLEPALVRQLAAHRSAVAVQRRCSDLAELLAAANAGVGSIAVIDAASGLVDAEMVRQLHGAKVRVLLLSHPDDVERTGALGADQVLAADLPPAQIAAQIAELAATKPLPVPPATAPLIATAPAKTSVIALSGPPGSTGRSTLAAALGAALATLGPTLLIDADMAAPSLDVRLSVLDDVSGLATCARRANQGRLDLAVLQGATQRVGDIDLLTGIGSAARWQEVLPATIPTIIRTAKEHYHYVVIDTESVPWPEADGYDQFRAHPGMVRTEVLHSADTVLHVARADADGIRRLLTYLHDSELHARDHLVVTQVSSQNSGPGGQATVLEVLARFSAAKRATLIRDDRRACAAALLTGAPLTLTAPRSPASQDIWQLAAQLTGRRRIAAAANPGRLAHIVAAVTAAARRISEKRRPAPRHFHAGAPALLDVPDAPPAPSDEAAAPLPERSEQSQARPPQESEEPAAVLPPALQAAVEEAPAGEEAAPQESAAASDPTEPTPPRSLSWEELFPPRPPAEPSDEEE